jgi:hypothetical protein
MKRDGVCRHRHTPSLELRWQMVQATVTCFDRYTS